MKTYEYEWAIYTMLGNKPSEDDTWEGGGYAESIDEAISEIRNCFRLFVNEETPGIRYEIFKVKRKLIKSSFNITNKSLFDWLDNELR
jgi:hypothetical protein